jgi:hypothetical protein
LIMQKYPTINQQNIKKAKSVVLFK